MPARDTSSYRRLELPKAGPEVMLPTKIDKKTGLPIKPRRFGMRRVSSTAAQGICNYYWDGPSRE